MKFLLTSVGIANASIHQALIELFGKPIEQCNALCIPTAIYALPSGTGDSWLTLRELAGLGWREFGVLELTALPSVPEECWLPALEAADCLIVGGGNGGYLNFWMQESGLAAKLPALLRDKVYLGVSAGSVVVTHSFQADPVALAERGVYRDADFEEDAPLGAGSDKTLGLVDFVIRPHLNADYFPTATLERFARSAAALDVPLYAFDDQTALAVVDGDVRVISEGEWKLFDR
ncbi:MAG TPA: Type 1 glutamine amidotransferase-like domain-containing protein [Thermomicrobiales bacterium]|jgi:dipeptidase E